MEVHQDAALAQRGGDSASTQANSSKENPPDQAFPRTARTHAADIRSNDEVAPCLSVVMPVYNEATSVAKVVLSVLEQRPVQELIVVDDYSTDKTWESLQELDGKDKRLKLLRHEKNKGKGAALRTGFSHASAPVVIIQDADFEYSPSEYYLVL